MWRRWPHTWIGVGRMVDLAVVASYMAAAVAMRVVLRHDDHQADLRQGLQREIR
jgi:hypothetical protein